MAAAVTGSVQLQSHVFRNPSDSRDVEATPFARRTGAVTRTVTTQTRSCRFMPPYRFVISAHHNALPRIPSHDRPPSAA